MRITFARLLLAAGLVLSHGIGPKLIGPGLIAQGLIAQGLIASGLLAAGLLATGGARAAGPSSGARAKPPSPVACQLNKQRGRCLVTPTPKDGLRIQFKGGPQRLFVFTPAGPPTTLNRAMRDSKGRVWLMTGHHSFTLRQVGGQGDVIQVTAP